MTLCNTLQGSRQPTHCRFLGRWLKEVFLNRSPIVLWSDQLILKPDTGCQEMQQLPIHLAVICRVNLSTARGELAELKKDLALAEEVADDFELIPELFHASLQPLCLKHCEEQLQKAQSLVQALSGNG